jgi:hypothetical protein
MLSPKGFQRKLGPGLPSLWLNMLALPEENHPKVTFEVHMTFWKWAVSHDFLAKSHRMSAFMLGIVRNITADTVLAQLNGPAVACQTKSIAILGRSSNWRMRFIIM